MNENQDLLTIEHLSRFGTIINSFARLEYLIQVIMAAVAQIDDFKIVILTKGLSYGQKRDALYSYLSLYKLKDQQQEMAIKGFLDRAHEYNSLRNNIAHALWAEGSRPGTIRASYIDVRSGRGKIVGYDEEDKDYSIDELGNIANELRSIVNDLIRYLRGSGIKVIAENIDRANVAS